MQKRKNLITALFVISLLFLGVSIIIAPQSILLILTCIVFILMIGYCFQNLENNVFLFCFLICFFTYLLSGQVLDRVLGVYNYGFSDEIELHTDLSLLISLIGLLIGYLVSRKVTFGVGNETKNQKTSIDFNGSYCITIRKIGRYAFYLSYVFWLFTMLDRAIYVYRHGYINYYISYSANVNIIIRVLGSVAPSAFYLFLATMPKKKEIRLPLALYLIYMFLSLGTGRRIHFMTGVVLVFAYFLCRNSINPDVKPWIPRKTMIRIIITIPLLITAMYLFEYIRSDYYVGNSDDYSPIVGFFIRQGTSINVIKYAEKYKSGLDPSAHYSLYTLIRWLQSSFINRLLGLKLDFAFGVQTEMTALHGTNLADYVSYKAMPYTYLRGGGWGSCYIAELYADFGYIGVLLGSILYGVLLDGILKGIRLNKSIWSTALGLLIVSSLFKAPRASFDDFLANFLYFYNWIIIPFAYIIVKRVKQKK